MKSEGSELDEEDAEVEDLLDELLDEFRVKPTPRPTPTAASVTTAAILPSICAHERLSACAVCGMSTAERDTHDPFALAARDSSRLLLPLVWLLGGSVRIVEVVVGVHVVAGGGVCASRSGVGRSVTSWIG